MLGAIVVEEDERIDDEGVCEGTAWLELATLLRPATADPGWGNGFAVFGGGGGGAAAAEMLLDLDSLFFEELESCELFLLSWKDTACQDTRWTGNGNYRPKFS